MDKTVELIKHLKWDSFVEINNLNITMSYSQALGQKNIYFVCGLWSKQKDRCSDDDIKTKKYFVVDIDMRLDYYKSTKTVLSQEEMLEVARWIRNILDENWFGDYCAINDSWNGIHLFFSWTERSFDKNIYSDWVSYIYNMINKLIKDYWFVCDPVCSNLARIIRMPWTINPRKKEKKDEILWDLWDYECNIIDFIPRDSIHFEKIEEYAELYRKDKIQEKETRVEIKKIIKEHHKPSNLRAEINEIPAWDVACAVWWVEVDEKWLESTALSEGHKNMWAYWYKPDNIIVNVWSSLIKTKDKRTFTNYEMVFYELMWKDAKATLEYFRDKHWIKIDEKKSKLEIPQKQYTKKWYLYWSDVFEPFDCVMSWELITVVAQSNSWKTSFALDMMHENSVRWRKCFYINLEFPIRTVWESRWLFLNGKRKRNMTDLDPLSSEDQNKMKKYVDEKLKQFEYYNEPNWMELDELVELILKKSEEGYWFIVVDTFSKITWNLDSQKAHTNQNKTMETMQSVCQKLWIVVMLLHHTNKKWEFEWSQKIMDLSNVFITITRDEDAYWNRLTKFELSKDKFISTIELELYYTDQKYSLEPPIKKSNPF